MAEENMKIKKKNTPVIIIILVILLSVVVSAAVFHNQIIDALRNILQVEQQSDDGLKKEPNVFLNDEDAEEYVKDKIPSMNINMSQTIRCHKNEDGKLVATVNVKNNNDNQYMFQLVMADTEEVIYTSGLIPANGALKEIPIDKDLKSGKYSVNVVFAFVSEKDNKTDLGSSGINVEMIVE